MCAPQDLLNMVPGGGGSYPMAPTSVSMSRLNPRAPDFSSVKTQAAPLFNASVPPPSVPYPAQAKYTRWPYPVNYPPDMLGLLAGAGDPTPPTSPPHNGPDERKVPPRPIGTERAWKQYTNVSAVPEYTNLMGEQYTNLVNQAVSQAPEYTNLIGGTPVEDSAPWLQQDVKNFGGIGDNRHMFRSSVPQAYPRADLPPPPLDSYNMNGATLMVLPQQQWDQGGEKPQIWTKWTN